MSKMFRQAKKALVRPGRSSTQNFDSNSGSTSPQDLGLHLIHDPGSNFPVDIIFVHGFEQSKFTWCDDHDPELFWPDWLPLDNEVAKARISRYCYDATSCSAPTFSIREIAQDLLIQMSLPWRSPAFGTTPIMFVAFSLGGLVVKQAQITGLENKAYREMTRQFSGAVFLATPHRGDDLSNPLSRALRSHGSASKAVAAMVPNSGVLELINYRFRHVSAGMEIASFYETLTTKQGMSRALVLGRDASTLGYPGEYVCALATNHSNMCKFTSTDDVNYLQVLNGLKRVMDKIFVERSPLYEPLSFAKSEIRLLDIAQTTDDTQPIVCSLKPMPLYDAPPYAALSYCWGEELNKLFVLVNQQEMAVNSNLHAALLRLRSRKVNCVWVDAVCINQDDMEERSIQIGRMAGIYRQAQEVVVWLGEAGDIGESALEEMELATSNRTVETTSRLLSRGYWSRVWIIQELAAASKISVLCGAHRISWQTIENAIERNRKGRAWDRVRRLEPLEDDEMGEPSANFERILSLRRNQQAGKPITMFDALYLSAHAQATDARDKLYALLGLAFDGARFVPHPNYSLSTEAVYHQFSLELLHRGFPLNIMHLRSVKRGIGSISPSWAVDWRDLNEKSLLVVFVRISTFLKTYDTSNQGARGNFDVQGVLLTAHGVRIGTVQSLDRDESAQNVTAAAPATKCHLEQAFTCSVSRPVEDSNNLFRLAATLGLYFESDVCTQLSVIMGLPERQRVARLRAFLGAHQFYFGSVEAKDGQSLREGSINAVELSNMRATEEGFFAEQMGSAILDGMLITFFEDIIIGCVPPQSRSGDVIVALSGCTIPVVLRKRECHGYQVVGTAWIYGQVNGEASFSEQPTENFEIF